MIEGNKEKLLPLHRFRSSPPRPFIEEEGGRELVSEVEGDQERPRWRAARVEGSLIAPIDTWLKITLTIMKKNYMDTKNILIF